MFAILVVQTTTSGIAGLTVCVAIRAQSAVTKKTATKMKQRKKTGWEDLIVDVYVTIDGVDWMITALNIL